ncbi:hypothetical protein ElP_41120 [Tautonia plasticadhaerens]|uniref:WD40-like Beta Propeller Repeat protein n=1 Tax=Tautonia plasticadhaerens TaxID=2527974 RepID=A0A518H5T3_9BACT|nr:hypothetical protein ElP_41120 [Tautonia plasticadhaerens]
MQGSTSRAGSAFVGGWFLALLSTLGGLTSLEARHLYAPGEGRSTEGGGPVSADGALSFPPRLPGGKDVVTDTSEAFLRPPASLRSEVEVAETPPTVDLLYYPGQDYPGQPWSGWGDGLATRGKYYSSIGDHLTIGMKGDGSHGTGTARVFEYDPRAKRFRMLVDVARVFDLPEGHYTPGKIHSRLDLGRDGRLYFSTHRGSPRSAIDRYRYRGDWIIRCDPEGGRAEVVAHGPVPGHSIPCGVLDPARMIFYGGTAAGPDVDRQGIRFFAYDVARDRLLYAGPDGPSRAMIFAASTGRVYWVPNTDEGPLMRFDPESGGPPVEVGGRIGVRAATGETPGGRVYTASSGQGAADADLWSFDTETEATARIGTVAVGTQSYVASLDADPTGRYVYYIPGAHGGSERDGSPVVQFDVETGRKRVLAFLDPFYQERYGLRLKGSYGSALSADGERLYVTWNVSRGGRAWDSCALTVIHIPEAERRP